MTLEDQEKSHCALLDEKCLISNVTEALCREVNDVELGTLCTFCLRLTEQMNIFSMPFGCLEPLHSLPMLG